VRETVRIASAVRAAGQLDAPVWKLEHERIPALRTPPFSNAAAFENEVLSAPLAQVIAHREPRLPAAHNKCFDVLAHGRDRFADVVLAIEMLSKTPELL